MTQMVRTNLASRFGILRDVRPVPDPWGVGIVFLLERSDSREHLEYLATKQAENPVLRKFEIASAKGTIAALAESLDKEGFDHATLAAKTAEAVRDIDFTAAEMLALRPDVVGSVARRIKGWSGLKDEDTGADVECTEETKLSLLTSSSWVEEGLPFGGKTLGAALLEFLSQESEKHADYREAVLADSGKGCGPTSAGSMTTTDVSTPTAG